MENQIITIIVAVLSSGLVQFFFTRNDRRTKILKSILKNDLWQMIDRAKDRGYKTHSLDDDFCEMMQLYKDEGNGNSQSMYREWDAIPFKEV